MHVMTKRRWLLIGAVELAAVALGVGAAFAAGNGPTARSAYAANHCTHYSYPYSTDFNCTVFATMNSSDPIPKTNGFALRDNNHIAMASSRSWQLWYENQTGQYFGITPGEGTFGASQGSGATYARAYCWFSSTVDGYCETDWHD